MFNMEAAVRANNGFVDWRLKNVEVGDIVFIYKTMPDGCIKFMMEVVKTNLLEHERFNQNSFWIDKDSFSPGIGIYARLKLVDVLNEKVLTIRALRDHGIKGNIQTKRECPKGTLAFIMDKGAQDSHLTLSGEGS